MQVSDRITPELQLSLDALTFFSDERRLLRSPGQCHELEEDRASKIRAANNKLNEHIERLAEASLTLSDQDFEASLHKTITDFLAKREFCLLANLVQQIGVERTGPTLRAELVGYCMNSLSHGLEECKLDPAMMELLKVISPGYLQSEDFCSKVEQRLRKSLESLELFDCHQLLTQIVNEFSIEQQHKLYRVLDEAFPQVRSRLSEIGSIEDSDLKMRTVLGPQLERYAASLEPDDLMFFSLNALRGHWSILFALESLSVVFRGDQKGQDSTAQMERLHYLTSGGVFC